MVILFFSFLLIPLTSHYGVEFSFEEDDIYIVERFHKVSQEKKLIQEKHTAYLSVKEVRDGRFLMEGNFTFYTSQDSRTYRKEEEYPAKFFLNSNGKYTVEHIYTYPNLLGIPTFPSRQNPLPAEWTGEAREIISIPEISLKISVPFPVYYRYAGIEEIEYRNEKIPVHKIHFDYILNHRVVPGNGPIKCIKGKSRGVIYFSEKYGIPVYDTQVIYYEFILGNRQIWKQTIEIESFHRKIKKENKENLSKKLQEQLQTEGVVVETNDRGVLLNLGNILFDFDSSAIKPEAREILDSIAEVLKEYPERQIQIFGHTDNTGEESYNARLSERRAKTIAEYFVQKGIPSENISYKGFGSTRPLVPNDSKENRARNRRVEIFILTE